MKVKGMEVISAKLSKAEVTKRLKKLFILKMHGGLSHKWGPGMRISNKELNRLFDEMLERKAKQKPPQAEWTEEDVLQRVNRHLFPNVSSPALLKKLRKKFKTPIVKCLGTSRKKCPECDGKVKIWQNCFHKELLCIRCGWTTRVDWFIA